jgi:hypothetical protein
MARYTKSASGKYQIHGKSYELLCGTRAQVWHGTAYKTSGGLKKAQLMQNKSGRIVSEKKHNSAKHDNRLVKSGYGTKKGKFGWVKVSSKRRHSKRHSKRKSRRSMKGGSTSPASSFGNAETVPVRVEQAQASSDMPKNEMAK